MATIYNTNDRIIVLTSNIIINIDDNNIGEMYIYDDKYKYLLNGVTASDLVDYFSFEDDAVNSHLAEEIKDAMMNLTINQGTH